MKYLAVAASALMFASPAYATNPPPYHIMWDPQCTSHAGNCLGLPSYTTAPIIESFDTPAAVNGSAYNPKTVAGLFSEQVKEQNNHPHVNIFNTARSGMTGQYIGIVSGSDYIINFLNGGMSFFSFAFNSLANNDKLTLTFASGAQYTLIGQDVLNGGAIIGVKNNAIPTGTSDWGRVSYDFLGKGKLVSADFHSGSGTWYIDSIAAAAPEPATWALMILGFGIAGSQLRRRRRRVKLAAA